MEDFDTAREERKAQDRTFKIGGETFTRKAGVKPSVMYAYEDMEGSVSAREAHKIVTDLIYGFVEEGDHQRLADVLDRDDDPVTIADLNDLVRWLIRSSAGRPTAQPSPSTDGPGTTGTPLTAISSGEPAEESAA